MELLIPDEYKHHECDDVKYAYENGFYDGRDEAFDSITELDDVEEWIRDEKSKLNMTFMEMAEYIDVSISSLQNMVSGHYPTMKTLSTVADALGYKLCLVKKE